MSFAAKAVTVEAVPRVPCSVRAVLDDLEPAEREHLTWILLNKTVPQAYADIIGEGYEVSLQQIQRHRLGMRGQTGTSCSCFR